MTSFKLLRAVRTADARFHTIWFMASELTGLKSCWLFSLEYYARESVADAYSEYLRVETSAGSCVGRAAGQQLVALQQLSVVATPLNACVKAQGRYFEYVLLW